MGRLSGKNCVITGAAKGIGLETSILFVQNGANVLMCDKDEALLKKSLEEVKEFASEETKVASFVCDVSKEDKVEEMIGEVDAWGGLDVLFNNAGIMEPDDEVHTSEEIWKRTHDINVKGVWYGCRYAVMSFEKHNKKKASVINTASVVALVGSATPQLAYTASKGAVLAMTRELGIVYARKGWRFNSLCPAPLNTALLNNFLGDDKAKRRRREVHFPTGRFGEAIEQAHMVVFLASDEANFVTAQEMIVDGGMTKAYVTPEGEPTKPPKGNAKLDENPHGP
ncbi:short-chain dehydrogenase/reductase [Geopyxis carbonaria]|nr:short-chain dehydrogenase/reductase [Geopyxis carbonaria]